MPRKSKEAPTIVNVPDLEERILVVTVGGEAMLQNRMTEDARRVIKGESDPGDVQDYTTKAERWEQTLHRDPKTARIGFPAEAFQKAMASVLKAVELSPPAKRAIKYRRDLFSNLHIESDVFDQDGIGIVLFAKGKPEMCEHWATLRGKTPIPVYRALVRDWEAGLRIFFNPSVLTDKDILFLLNRGGAGSGVGAYRPEKGGPYGVFRPLRARYEKRTLKVQKAAAA